MINIAIVGLGTIARDSHIPSIKKSGEFHICSAVDLKESPDTELYVYKSIEDAANNEILDAFAICTPPKSHYKLAKEALKFGHVLLEKPPVLNVNELDELINCSNESKHILYFGYHTACNPVVAKLKSILINKTIKSIKATFLEQVTKWHDLDGWIFDGKISGGGVIMDVGINIISAIMKTLPDNEFIPSRAMLNKAEGFSVDTSAEIEFTDIDHNLNGHIKLDWLHGVNNPEVREIEFETSDGEIYILDLTYSKVFHVVEDQRIVIEVEYKYEYDEMYEQFYDHITKNLSYCPIKELKFICAVYDLS